MTHPQRFLSVHGLVRTLCRVDIIVAGGSPPLAQGSLRPWVGWAEVSLPKDDGKSDIEGWSCAYSST